MAGWTNDTYNHNTGELRQEDGQEFEASLCCVTNVRPARAAWGPWIKYTASRLKGRLSRERFLSQEPRNLSLISRTYMMEGGK